jgi:hypothetical protein
MVKATAYAPPPGDGLEIGFISTILAITKLLIAVQFPADGTRRSTKHPRDVGLGVATYSEASNDVPFLLRELVIATHVCILSVVGIEAYSIPALSFLRHSVALTS